MSVIRTYQNRQLRGRVYRGDALAFLRSLEKSSADIVFLDPPFNLGKKYSSNHIGEDRRPDDVYANWIEEILDESIRVLKPGGALYLYHIPIWAIRFAGYLGRFLHFRHWISIAMKNGFVRGKRLYPAHYALLYFTKGPQKHFRRPRIAPLTCRHCGQLIKNYGGYRRIIQRKGINLSDFWDDLSPVRHNARKHRNANELPTKMLERVISISGARGGHFVDPFAGSGTGVLMAAKAGMTFRACDIVSSNCKIICARLDRLRDNQAD